MNPDILAAQIAHLAADNARLRSALIEIRDHWANQYDHPRKLNNRMYDGPYGMGVTDGHRLCAQIARKALEDNPATLNPRLDVCENPYCLPGDCERVKP